MTTDILIRPVEVRDYDQWLPLWKGYNEFYGRHGTTALPEEVTLSTWNRFFDPSEPVHAFVAVQDDKLVGIVHYIFHRSTISIQPTCYLQDLFTLSSMRGRGVGRLLIEAVYAQAQKNGCARVYWLTHHTNATARRLYDLVAEDSGFIVYRKPLG